MDERRSYRGFAGSSVLHGALLALILFGLASAPKFEDSPESIPVEIVSQSELNQIMNGEKDAKPAPAPTPAPPAPPEAPPDLRAAEEPTPAPAPPPKPEPPPPPPKPAAEDALAQPPVRPKIVEPLPQRPKEPTAEKPKPDQLAKLLERDKSEPAPKPQPPSRSYDPNLIAKIIAQSKPLPASVVPAQTGATPQGLPHHDSPRMSISMTSALDAWLTERYLECWTPPPTMPEGDTYVAEIKVVYNADGSLSARPVLLNPPTDSAWRAHAESAMRAVKKCDPLHIPAQFAPFFDEWKIQTIHFDPRETQG